MVAGFLAARFAHFAHDEQDLALGVLDFLVEHGGLERFARVSGR